MNELSHEELMKIPNPFKRAEIIRMARKKKFDEKRIAEDENAKTDELNPQDFSGMLIGGR